MNAALDRTLTVPNFQLGHRHRASAGLTLAGGKGINVRAQLEGARRSRRRDGPRRRAYRHAVDRGADRRVDPQRLRPHRRRVAHVDDGRRPDRRLVHGDLRMGPAGEPRRARHAAREDCVPRARRRPRRLRRLTAARRRSGLLRGGDPRAVAPPRARRARHGGRAVAARRRGGAVARLAEPVAKPRASSGRSSTTRRTS